jgi:hypothetical protein
MTDDVKAEIPINVASRLVCQEGEVNSLALVEMLGHIWNVNESVGPLRELAVSIQDTILDSMVEGPVQIVQAVRQPREGAD